MAWARVASSWMATIQGEMMRRAVCSPYSRSSWISSAWASGKSSRTCSARASGRSSMTAAALSAGIWSSISGQLGRVEVLDQRRARGLVELVQHGPCLGPPGLSGRGPGAGQWGERGGVLYGWRIDLVMVK